MLKNLFLAALLAGTISTFGADAKKDQKAAKGKPYPLKTCIVSDEKLGGDMGEPYVFVHEGQQIKLCCESCKKDFDKAPATYLKKIASADKKKK